MLIDHVNDELKALRVGAEGDSVDLEQVDLPVDLSALANDINLLFLERLKRCRFVMTIWRSCLKPYLLYFVIVRER